MFIGHYATAFAARAIKPDGPSLGLLFVAAQLVDYGFFVLVAAGIEHARPNPSLSGLMPIDLYHMPFTHSIPALLVWMLAGAALAWALAPKRARVLWALVAGLVVGSHWLLDLPVHREDLALWDGATKVGFGLWDHPRLAMALELAVLALCALWYGAVRGGGWRLRVLIGALLAAQAVNWFGPPPEMGVSFWALPLVAYSLFAGLAWWIEQPRTVKSPLGL
jgi:hypothetical protein